MAKINLIPEVRQEKLHIAKLNQTATTVVIVLSVVLAVVIIGLASYAGVLTAQKASMNSEIASVQNNLDTMKSLETTVVNLEGGLADIKTIVNNNKDWNNFFSVLEKNTPNDVQITSLAINDGAVSASLKGKDIKSVDRFINSFSNAKNDKGDNYFKDLLVSGYTKSENGQYTFEAKFNLNEAAIW